mmetsp:Transcript_30020/g.48132  ORF Transcript_30020/g.48132 Transcript_30020/m.48132 type:complete len:260 (+) Transcript_30020:29-808(+)
MAAARVSRGLIRRSPLLALTTSCALSCFCIPPNGIAQSQQQLSKNGLPSDNCIGKIVLGSKSQTRQDILREMGYEFEILPANIDEKAIRCKSAHDLVLKLGHAKADAVEKEVASKHHHVKGRVFLITGDQVVVHEGRILEKPESDEEARAFIKGYSRSPPQTVGSVVLTDVRSGRRWARVDTAKMFYREIPDQIIDKLIEEGKIFHSAGGLRVEDPLVSPYIISIEGTKDSIMGLCKADVKFVLREALHNEKAVHDDNV